MDNPPVPRYPAAAYRGIRIVAGWLMCWIPLQQFASAQMHCPETKVSAQIFPFESAPDASNAVEASTLSTTVSGLVTDPFDAAERYPESARTDALEEALQSAVVSPKTRGVDYGVGRNGGRRPATAARPLELGESVGGGPIASVPADPFMSAQQEQRLLAELQKYDDSIWRDLTAKLLVRLLPQTLAVELETPELELVGVQPETVLNAEYEIAPAALGARLEALLAEHDLTYNLFANRVILTSREAACEHPPVRLYDVTPLVERLRSRQRVFDFDSLLRVIEACIAPDDWVAAGGTNSLSHLIVGPVGNERGLLIAACPSFTQLHLQALLDQLNGGPAIAKGQVASALPLDIDGRAGHFAAPPQPVFDDRMRGGFF